MSSKNKQSQQKEQSQVVETTAETIDETTTPETTPETPALESTDNVTVEVPNGTVADFTAVNPDTENIKEENTMNAQNNQNQVNGNATELLQQISEGKLSVDDLQQAINMANAANNNGGNNQPPAPAPANNKKKAIDKKKAIIGGAIVAGAAAAGVGGFMWWKKRHHNDCCSSGSDAATTSEYSCSIASSKYDC